MASLIKAAAMDSWHNKLNVVTILIRLQLLCHILAVSEGFPNQEEIDTYLVILRGSSVLHYDGSIPDFSVPPLRPDGRPDMLRYINHAFCDQ